jgi:hypothetical protein
MLRLTLSVALTLGIPAVALAQPATSVKVTVLSTMLAGNPNGGIGECMHQRRDFGSLSQAPRREQCGFRLQPEGRGCRQSMDRLTHPSG